LSAFNDVLPTKIGPYHGGGGGGSHFEFCLTQLSAVFTENMKQYRCKKISMKQY